MLFSLLDTIDRVVPIVFTNATKINEIADIIGRCDVISLLCRRFYGRSIILLVIYVILYFCYSIICLPVFY